MDILPIRVLTDQDSPVFGSLNVYLGKLHRAGLPVAKGICVTPPTLTLKTTLEHYDFSVKEVFEQTLTLIKKEIEKTPIPEILLKETKGYSKFWVLDSEIKGVRELWLKLLDFWLGEVKQRIWKDGFYKGITESLSPKIVLFSNKVSSFGEAFLQPQLKEVVITVKSGKPHPNDLKKITEIVSSGDKKLFNLFTFEWVIDKGVKVGGLKHFTTSDIPAGYKPAVSVEPVQRPVPTEAKCAVKVFTDLSEGLTIEGGDGVFLAGEKIYKLEKPLESFDTLVLKLVEIGMALDGKPLLFKLADVTEGMGGIRGTLRLLHQKSLIEPLMKALDFAIFKKGISNVNLVLPFVRNSNELLQLKRELAVKRLGRRNNLKHWLEIAVPENIINLEDYLAAGIDGGVLNLDELLSHISGFDLEKEELGFYKKEILALTKFLEDPFKLLHKAKLPVVAYGSLLGNHDLLEDLIEKGIYGMVVPRYDSPAIKEVLYELEKRVILRRSS